MDLAGGAGIYVEIDSETCERVLDYLVVTIHDVLRADALLARLDCNRNSVFIRTAYKEHVFAPHTQVPDVYVGRNVNAREVTYVYRPVRIRERAGD